MATNPLTLNEDFIASTALPKVNYDLSVKTPEKSGTYVTPKTATPSPLDVSAAMTNIKTATPAPAPSPTMAETAPTALPKTNIDLSVKTPPVTTTPAASTTTPQAPTGTTTSTTGTNTNPGTNTNTNTDITTDTGKTEQQKQDEANKAAREKDAADFVKVATQVQDTILGIQNGSVPLSPGEKAQIDGMRSQFEGLIRQQEQINANEAYMTTVAGVRSGRQQYAPALQAGIISNVLSAGLIRVSDLQIKEASSIATLTQSLRDNDIKAVKEAWSVYKDASEAKKDALQKTIDETSAAIKEAQKQALQAQQDALIVKAVGQGFNTPAEVFTALHGSIPLSQITTAMTSLNKDTSGITTKTDQVGSDVYQYQVDASGKIVGTPKKIISGPAPVGTAGERSANALSQFASAFVPGAKMADGSAVIDPSGYITPKAWKAAIADAPAEGLSRKDFIEQFGSQLYAPKDGVPDSSYGLTPSEIKIITGALPS